ncbi:UNKNOWN [Stylonychia lemnae]|uniref:Uncharacterized protein n=1 Tax=Stylonychia lemnae TaxID=5949 RepID=A0A078AZC5_STYLE|nr:UNKNOWN [Stylonychia lemnae]|eukprot:CDW87461.1 UNKNOWN [Stylonychia lemnae]
MNGAVVNTHPTHVVFRERQMENEKHQGDGVYVKTFETSKNKADRMEQEHNERYLDRDQYNDKDEPGKKFTEFVRKRDKLEEIHKHGRVRYNAYNSESDRVSRVLNKSPLSLEPLKTQKLVYPEWRVVEKEQWKSKQDMQPIKEMQSWQIWKDLSAERDVPLIATGDGCEPFLSKITKIQRDPRKKFLEKPKEFMAFSRNDLRRDQAILQTNSLRSFGSIKGLINLISQKFSENTESQNYITKTSFNFVKDQDGTIETENLPSTDVGTDQNSSRQVFSDSKRNTRSIKHLQQDLQKQQAVYLNKNDLRSHETISNLLKLKHDRNSALILLKQDSNKSISINKNYQDTIEELNDSHIINGLLDSSGLSKSYFKSAYVHMIKSPFKTKDQRDKEIMKNPQLRKSCHAEYKNRENVKSALEKITKPVNYKYSRRQSFTRNEKNAEAVKVQDQQESPNCTVEQLQTRDEVLKTILPNNNNKLQTNTSPSRNIEFGLNAANQFKTIDVVKQSKKLPMIKEVENKGIFGQPLQNHLNKDSIKQIVKAYFKNKTVMDTTDRNASTLDKSISITQE